MLSLKIDLTANRDFGSNTIDLMDTLVSMDVDGEEMTCDQYEALVWWEGVFGKKRHPNRKKDIFNPELKYYLKWKDTCYRCGKSIKAPWNNFGGICRRCEHEMNLPTPRLPWRTMRVVPLNHDRGAGIFDLR